MPVASDISTALHLLEHIHDRTKGTNASKLQMHTSEDLQLLISFLEDPVLRSIALIQDSLVDLNTQLSRHPSILPGDFDINLSGQLELSVPNTPVQPHEISGYQDLYQDGELDDQRVPVAPLLHTSSEDTTSAQVTSPSVVSDILGIPPITTPTYVKEFQKVIDAAAKGRHICTVQLYKPEGTSLGFSVVGLRSTDKGDLGIFLQEIQLNGIAGCDGRLIEGDQILAIDGQPLDSNISHEQAISILQKARGTVELVVARSTQDIGRAPLSDETSETTEAVAAAQETVIQHDTSDINHILYKDWSTSSSVIPFSAKNDSLLTPAPAITVPTSASEIYIVERCPSAISDTSKSDSDIMLNTEWAQVEVINLINDGSGLGFGIIGGKSTGVVVKTILPGGVADHDNRLQSGDHILQIGEVNLRGMGSEQVAAVLRQSGTHVRLVVARPVEPTSPDYQASGSHAPIVPTKILADPDELDRHLLDSVAGTYNIHHVSKDAFPNKECIFTQKLDVEKQIGTDRVVDDISNPISISTLPIVNAVEITSSMVKNSSDSINSDASPEVERFTIELKKDIYGLGITIAGYVCEKEELSGIFIKSISKGSAADISNRIQMNDRIIEVDGRSLQDCTNHEAVEMLRTTGPTVNLCLERYLRGPKYEQLQQVIAASESQNQPEPSSTSATRLQTFAINTTIHGGSSLQNLIPTLDRLVKAKSDGSLAPITSPTVTNTTFTKIKSRSLEPLTGIVTWNSEPKVIKLIKGERGLGFSILDYQDPMMENETVIIIRSLVPGGVAQIDGQLSPGDRLLFVNNIVLKNATLDQAVDALKSVPKGLVLIGIANPLPVFDSMTYLGRNEEANDNACSMRLIKMNCEV